MKRLIVSSLTAAVALCAGADTYYVAEFGDDANDGRSWETAKRSPEKVFGAWTSSRQTLIISNGTYKLSETMTLPDGNGIHVIKSLTGDPRDVILDGQGTRRVIYAQTYNTTFFGLTLTNGLASGSGGGLYLRGQGNLVTNCVVRNCRAAASGMDLSGGGIYCAANGDDSGRIVDCRFESCSVSGSGDSKKMRGGGLYGYETSVIGCEFKSCRVEYAPATSGGSSYRCCDGGGAFVEASACSLEVRDSVFRDCAASNITTKAQHVGSGGGLAVNKTVVVSNCEMSGNAVTYGGGGVYGYGAGVKVSNCTITNNCLTPFCTGGGAFGGSGVALNGGRLEKSLVAGNRCGNYYEYDSSSSAITLLGTGATVADCVIRDNIGGPGSCFLFSRYGWNDGVSRNCIVTNCLIKNNHCRGDRYGMIFAFDQLGTNQFVDCRFIGNTATNSSAVIIKNDRGSEFATTDRAMLFRNCFFTGNYSGHNNSYCITTSAYGGTGVKTILENCTAVSNTVWYFVDADWNDSGKTQFTGDNIFARGCLVMDHARVSGGGGAFRNLGSSLNLTYCCADSGLNTSDDSLHNLALDRSKPLFDDGTKGPYRPCADSQLVDKVPASAWMGDGRRNSPSRDMGSDSVASASGTEYGVAVSRTETNPRLSGGFADIGCFEFWSAPGLLLLVR